MLENPTKRIDRLKAEIANDLGNILMIMKNENTKSYEYYVKQRDKYIPATHPKSDNHEVALRKLKILFEDQSDHPPKWSHGEIIMNGGKGMFWAFGHTKLNGARDPSGTIRIEQKAFILRDTTFAGVMLHEATHWELGTGDYKYDNLLNPDFRTLQSIDQTHKYRNADNWRAFYQKMRTHMRNGE
jgi:hypothetical protein